MKILKQTFSLLIIASVALLISNCGGGSSETPVEKVQLGKLSKTWNIVDAYLTVGGSAVDRTPDFAGFKLAISGTFDKNAQPGDYPYSFTVSGSRPTPSPWPGAPGSGSWEFAGDPKTQLVRNDGIGIVYSINSSGVLNLQFTCDACSYAGARTSQVNGDWEFNLN